MKTSLIAAVTVLALVFAVVAPAAAQAPAGSTTNMEILVAKIKADKKLLVAETVGLTDAEGKAFWPVYDKCHASIESAQRKANRALVDYVGAESRMTDAYAKQIVAGRASRVSARCLRRRNPRSR
jgi:hypothetical protein